ncbi:PIN/TRAM domain-containing protein [Alicyclobacillus sp.]|uniref:PIN/TRAM domain-containing protein n=1 Tax=Alicyclobacillus sp. TaxID=61169 RepID=UPI0025B8F6F7|nr:PIN/TRAM domain-containing protein [Alicyclobacillus sp.]MCL6517301.1 PIN/TRAM domain-containing protein [Alicyclobacillus sp.]
MARRVARFVIALSGLGGGALVALRTSAVVQGLIGAEFSLWQNLLYLSFVAIIFGLLSYALAPWFIAGVWQVTNWLEGRIQKAPVQDVLAGSIGLIVGLVIANLLGTALARIPLVGAYLPTVGSFILGYVGMSVAVKNRDELVSVFGLLRPARDKSSGRVVMPKILDTSVIIDGRIADLCRTGFVEGPLVIPGFVLEELRHIADSSDTLKRNRGRRGLDVLNRIQKELDTPVEIFEREVGANLDVDSRLIKVAKVLGGAILTNDYNLNKVADLQGVKVLNVNELANAVKPVVLPGEEMLVHVIKDGKESGQGVAYLDDGTMIVIEGGREYIGAKVDVLVTSVLQTSAGRMIFAKPKLLEKAL